MAKKNNDSIFDLLDVEVNLLRHISNLIITSGFSDCIFSVQLDHTSEKEAAEKLTALGFFIVFNEDCKKKTFKCWGKGLKKLRRVLKYLDIVGSLTPIDADLLKYSCETEEAVFPQTDLTKKSMRTLHARSLVEKVKLRGLVVDGYRPVSALTV